MYDRILLTEEVCNVDGLDNVRYALFKENIRNVITLAISFFKELPSEILLERQDFIMIGLKALWDCTEEYNPTLGNKFWTYARSRVLGSMIDQIRDSDPVSRTYRDELKRIENHRQRIEQDRQRTVSFCEACHDLGISIKRANKIITMSSVSFVSLDSRPKNMYGPDSSTKTFAETIPDPKSIDQEFTFNGDEENYLKKVKRLLRKLKDRERLLIRLYFFKGLRPCDIALMMNVTRSRISQLLSKTLIKLREMMNGVDLFSRQ